MLRPMSDDQPLPRDADARWAEAQALLSGALDAAAEQRLRRTSRRRVLAVLAATLGAGVLVWLVVLPAADGGEGSSPGVPLWQVVTGFALATVGLVVASVTVVRQVRAVRHRRVRNGPLFVLTVAQRRELLAQVRGRAPVDPARVGLARRTAEDLLHQQHTIGTNVGLSLLWTGLAVALPSWWRVTAAVAYLLLTVVAGGLAQRDARRARAFLVAHT
jgi:hypothetical protein